MRVNSRKQGVVLVIVIFVAALLAALVMGMLQIDTEEAKLYQNHLYSTEALWSARAGLNEAFSILRSDRKWKSGFEDKPFLWGKYTVDISGTLPDLTITSTGKSNSLNYTAKVTAEVKIGISYPYLIGIKRLWINEEPVEVE